MKMKNGKREIPLKRIEKLNYKCRYEFWMDAQHATEKQKFSSK